MSDVTPVPASGGELSPLKRAFIALEAARARIDALEGAAREPIAIVGMGCRIPGGADSPAAFWQLMHDEVDATGPVPPGRWDADALYDPNPDVAGRIAATGGGYLASIDGFDPAVFGIAPREAATMDPQQRLLLEVAWEALEHAGIAPDRLERSATGVYVGVTASDYAYLQLKTADTSLLDAHFTSGIAHSIHSGRLSYLLGLQGPSLTIDTACSSSLVAVHLACAALRAGECRMALAGGVNLLLSPDLTIALSRSRMLAPDGRCKTFSASADGFARGEGCAVVVLKRLSDAQADGDTVLAVIRGSAVNQDGASSSLTAPNGPSQAAVMTAALARAGVAPHEVSFVEAHGTGTQLGDPIEVRALGEVFGPGRAAEHPLLIGSVKTNVGHLEGAAGVTGLVKVVLALGARTIPKHLHFDAPSPYIPWSEFPVVVPTKTMDWQPINGRRIAGISSFGFSGTNAHLIVEEAPAVATRVHPTLHATSWLFPLSAADPAALRQLARRYAAAFADRGDEALADACFTAGTARAQLSHRAVVLAGSMSELRERLTALADGADVAGVRTSVLVNHDPARAVFLFTGQGAQFAGMGHGLYDSVPVFRDAIDRCARILAPQLDVPLTELLWGTASDRLNETAYTQPALVALEWALAQLWRHWGVTPVAMLGHSIGEYVGACVAGVLSLEDVLSLVVARGRLMQELPAGGAMTAIAADEASVAAAVAPFAASVSVAAVNAPDQTVIAGVAADVNRIAQDFAARGIRVRTLPVSHAFHSPLLDPMLAALDREVASVTLSAPTMRLVSNLTGRMADAALLASPSYWSRHARSTVRFADGARTLAALRPDLCIEVGPQAALLAPVEHAFTGTGTALVPTMRRGRDEWEQLLDSAGAMWLRGATLDWAAMYAPFGAARAPLPTYPWQRTRHWFTATAPTPVASSGRPTGHPLLGARLRSATTDVVYESRVSPTAPAWVGAHRVQGHVVMPATAYLETLRAAAADAFGTPLVTVTEVTVREAMLLDAEGRVLQVIVDGTGDARAARCVTTPADGDIDAPFTEHASAILSRGAAPDAGAPSLAEARARCRETIDAAAFYADFTQRGLDFASAFRTVQHIARTSGEAVAEIALDATTAADASAYGIHPVLLDGCLQAISAALPVDDSPAAADALFLPIAVGSFSVHGAAGSRCWCHATASGTGATRQADITVYSEVGELLATVRGVRLARASAGALARLGARWLDDALYQVRWERDDSANEARAPEREPALDATLAPATLAATAANVLGALSETTGLDRYDTLQERLEILCGAYVERAFAELGWRPSAGERVTAEPLREQLGVLPRHRRLFARLLDIASEDKLISRDGDEWVVRRAPELVDTDTLRDHLAADWGPDAPELELTARTGAQLAEALRGTADPHALLFPGGSTETAERMYRDAAPARVMNGLVSAALSAAAVNASASRPLRILEVGGGTGGTTAHLAPLLPADRVQYTFTDVGPLFVSRARGRFATHPFMRFDVLDLETEPEAQGFIAGAYDLVIATNVIHATADLRRTLARVRRLLAPGGVLAMLEVTAPQRWFDLTVGLTDGWWAFTDTDLRSDYATLPRSRWLSLLTECGFATATSVPAVDPDAGSLSRQALLLASVPSSADADARRDWLLFADTTGTIDALAETLRARGNRCVVAREGDHYTLAGDVAMVRAASRGDVDRLFGELRDAGRVVAGVVHAGALNTSAWESATDDSLARAQQEGVIGALHVAQAVLAAPMPAPRLWLVTCGAQQADALDAALDPAHATVWGLGIALGLEHPELAASCLDLDPAVPESHVETLVAELSGSPREPRVAYRAGERRVARLERLRAVRPATTAARWRLARDAGGSLDALHREPAADTMPGVGEVEIAVEATGLNFKDVLNALGMYPGDAGPLGGECAGVVTRVGHGVTQLRAGDRVLAVARGSFASHVMARASLVQVMPEGMSMEEGAAFPIAYLTAHFCLDHLAHVGPRDRVLIHAAAGGVGLAAVRIAQRAGAEVFATAGSPWKREMLRALGVQHVFDSRTPAFAGEIRAATGGHGVDVVLNSLSGEMLDASFAALAAGGRFVEIGKRGIRTAAEVADKDPAAQYFIVDWGETESRDPALVADMLASLVAQYAAGRIAPLPRHVFPSGDERRAFRFMAQARHAGRIVVSTASPASRMTDTLVRRDGTYLVTGGLSGLGLVIARWLGERGAGRVVLLSRRGVTAEAEPVIAELRERGVTVLAEPLDVSDGNALAALLERLRASGPPLRGVLHGAGALDDAGLLAQNAERFDHVLAPKVRGGFHLDRLTRPDALDWFVSFSSIAAVLGARGQANHSAANAFLDVLARERRSRGLPGLSINWGAWSDTGAAVDRGAGDRLAAQGLAAITSAQGIQALERLMAMPEVAQAVVLPADWTKFSRERAGAPMPLLAHVAEARGTSARSGAGDAHTGAGSAAAASGPGIREQLAATPSGRRRALVQGVVRERALRALGLDAARAVDPRTPLGDLGLDSLLAVELRNALGTALGASLPATLLFDHPTIDALTDHLLHDVLGEARTGAAADDASADSMTAPLRPALPASAPAGALVSSIEALSDDDVERMLATRSRRK